MNRNQHVSPSNYFECNSTSLILHYKLLWDCKAFYSVKQPHLYSELCFSPCSSACWFSPFNIIRETNSSWVSSCCNMSGWLFINTPSCSNRLSLFILNLNTLFHIECFSLILNVSKKHLCYHVYIGLIISREKTALWIGNNHSLFLEDVWFGAV